MSRFSRYTVENSLPGTGKHEVVFEGKETVGEIPSEFGMRIKSCLDDSKIYEKVNNCWGYVKYVLTGHTGHLSPLFTENLHRVDFSVSPSYSAENDLPDIAVFAPPGRVSTLSPYDAIRNAHEGLVIAEHNNEPIIAEKVGFGGRLKIEALSRSCYGGPDFTSLSVEALRAVMPKSVFRKGGYLASERELPRLFFSKEGKLDGTRKDFDALIEDFGLDSEFLERHLLHHKVLTYRTALEVKEVLQKRGFLPVVA